MKILEKMNSIYGKFLSAIIPMVTVMIALVEIFKMDNDILHIIAYIVMGFMTFANYVKVGDAVWAGFICFASIGLIFIIVFKNHYNKETK